MHSRTRRAAVVLSAFFMLPIVGIAACNTVLKVDELKVGECLSEEKSCADNTPRICTGEGHWQVMARCENATCKDGGCIGQCEMGKKQCKGKTPQFCTADGQWDDQAPCGMNEDCQGGICKIVCTPGDTRCPSGAFQPQRCDANGQWQNEGMPCDPCRGCNEINATCSQDNKDEGTECIYDDPCTLRGICSAQGECMKDPNYLVKCATDSECSVMECNPATGSCEAEDGTSCEDRDICTATSMCASGRCTGPAEDRSFAHWDMKTAAPDAGMRFTILSYGQNDPDHEADELVYDTWTHLLWERRTRPAPETLTFDDASDYCKNQFKPPGYPSGWRLPTRIELISLVNYEATTQPAIYASEFPYLGDKADEAWEFWTSSPSAKDPYRVWRVSFVDGLVLPAPKTQSRNFRCVR